MPNLNALMIAALLTAMCGLAGYLIAFDEPCAECQHSRWSHGDKDCAGQDGWKSYVSACRCRGYKLIKERK